MSFPKSSIYASVDLFSPERLPAVARTFRIFAAFGSNYAPSQCIFVPSRPPLPLSCKVQRLG